MFQRFKKLFIEEHGASPWIAIFSITVLLAFTAMAVDLGIAYMQASKLQSALDAGALAGANYLPNTTEATAAAIECVQLNGYTSSDVVVSFSDSNSKISLDSAKEVDTMFLQVLGISEWNINKHAAAAKTGGSGGGVFDYRLFYGDPTGTYNMGGTFNINGSIHSNGSYDASPGTSTITGSLEVVKRLQYNQWTMTIGNIVNPAQHIDMPDFTEAVNKIMPTTYDEYKNASVYNSISSVQNWYNSKYITGNLKPKNTINMYGDVYIKGNFTSNGGACNIFGNLYVDGDLTFNNTVYAKGSVMATGNITFNGGGYKVQTSSPVCIYSKTGDIDANMSSITATGILYAPNGTITLQGQGLTVYGSIVAKRIAGSPGGLTVGEPSQPIDFLPGNGETSIKLVE